MHGNNTQHVITGPNYKNKMGWVTAFPRYAKPQKWVTPDRKANVYTFVSQKYLTLNYLCRKKSSCCPSNIQSQRKCKKLGFFFMFGGSDVSEWAVYVHKHQNLTNIP